MIVLAERTTSLAPGGRRTEYPGRAKRDGYNILASGNPRIALEKPLFYELESEEGKGTTFRVVPPNTHGMNDGEQNRPDQAGKRQISEET